MKYSILITRLCLSAGAIACSWMCAHSIGAKPGLLKVSQPDGSTVSLKLVGNEWFHAAFSEKGKLMAIDEKGYYLEAPEDDTLEKRFADAKGRRGPGLMKSGFPAHGDQKALVILIEFADQRFSVQDPKDFYTRMLNEEGFADYKSTGSARDYFIESSAGSFRPEFEVYGPARLSRGYAYYGANQWNGDAHPEEMLAEGAQILDDEIDFSQYDLDGDGIVDNVYLFYAGYGEADGGNPNTVWPHAGNLLMAGGPKRIHDGVTLNHYACSNELQAQTGLPDGIGTFCHEFGHVLGLPDLYSTLFMTEYTPYEWDIMDVGSYNNNSRTPPYYSSFERYALDWIELTELTEGAMELPPLGDSNFALIANADQTNEYFLFENRQHNGFDSYLPGHGMLIWHIDYYWTIWSNNTVNVNNNHQYVDLLEADGEISRKTSYADAFPGPTGATEFSPVTVPAFIGWSGRDMPYRLHNISEGNDGIIRFDVEEFLRTTGIISNTLDAQLRIEGNNVVHASGRSVKIHDISGRFAGIAGNSPLVLSPGIYIASDGQSVCKFRIPYK